MLNPKCMIITPHHFVVRTTQWVDVLSITNSCVHMAGMQQCVCVVEGSADFPRPLNLDQRSLEGRRFDPTRIDFGLLTSLIRV